VEYVAGQVEGSALRIEAAREAAVRDAGFVEFAMAGSEAAGEFRCADCGYGAVVQRGLPQCPMCGGTVWERPRSSLPRRSE
jgi:rubrerythrin